MHESWKCLDSVRWQDPGDLRGQVRLEEKAKTHLDHPMYL